MRLHQDRKQMLDRLRGVTPPLKDAQGRLGAKVVLDPDSFLMKGEIVDADTVWRGNPARAIRGAVASQMAA